MAFALIPGPNDAGPPPEGYCGAGNEKESCVFAKGHDGRHSFEKPADKHKR